jgi:hypothetical protein
MRRSWVGVELPDDGFSVIASYSEQLILGLLEYADDAIGFA